MKRGGGDGDERCSLLNDRTTLIFLFYFKTQEPVFMTLSTIHNIQYMNDLMKKQRQLILEDKI